MNSTVAEDLRGTLAAEVQVSGSARLRGLLRLTRPANLVTSAADVLAGMVLAGAGAHRIMWPVLASVCLYGGGIVLNDFFDRGIDAIERPERPIPSGVISPRTALGLGSLLLVTGAACALMSSRVTGLIAVALIACILTYDSGMKNRAAGPLVMGSCRALNLLIGISTVPSALSHFGYLAILPLVYISGLTMLSRGEVYGGSRVSSLRALVMFAGVVIGAAVFSMREATHVGAAAVFLLLLVVRAGWPLWRASVQPVAPTIRAAVHAGIVSLIVLDAALASSRAGVLYGAAILSLSVLASELAKLFPVT